MKRFLGILCCVFAFSGCDDGDLVVDTIDFTEVATSTCGEANNLIFKLKDGESLIINVPDGTFKMQPTVEPIKLPINPLNQVVYNFYDGKVSSNNICALIPPATPNIKTQWNAASGVIEITTETVKKFTEADNSTRITGYKHNIIFTNITFTKGDGTTQFYEEFIFGDYLQNVTTSLPFAFDEKLNICDDNGVVFEISASETFTLNIDPELILNEDTPPGQPRTGVIGVVNNKLTYCLFNSVVTDQTYFCQSTQPALPTVKEEWTGVPGGTIEVTTVTSGPNVFKHTIVLKSVSLASGLSNFQLGDNYLYGNLQTVKP
ncbi:hypothetical protein [Flavobacterium sp. 5]|uniref:hypothetical protein n=1 Tax=Flavobacterium sp. 5 TaxID=2035199 RepID=UPI000C2C20B9|nr:hypothetical protein [Flavobacterium sp. 5]PKB18075.1 hypothetical protein CLU82_3331 [Flavobacterium sp. 5]